MPTIVFSLKELGRLVGKKISVAELEDLMDYAKGEFDEANGDEITVSVGDTNLPCLWSVEGLARLFRGALGKEKGLKKLNVLKSKDRIIVEPSVKAVRPFIGAFSVKNCNIDENLLIQIIQLQEKLCHSFGMKRKKVAIGIYDYRKIKFPVHYKAVNPESVEFMPLEFKRKMTLGEILESHPKGIEYAWILKDARKYPLLIDSDKNVLSFPPIINSDYSGKVEPGNNDLFFEATGTELDAVRLATNIFAYAFAERGCKIHSVAIKYGSKTEQSPHKFNDKMKIDAKFANKVLGTSFKEKDVKQLLEKARFGYSKGHALIPDYRQDLMHPVDIVEELAVSYGYDRIEDRPLASYSTGSTFDLRKFVDKIRELMIGLNYQEAMSPILSNKNLLYDLMDTKDFGTVEISNPMTGTHSVVRSWILPQLLDLLSKNKKEEYPQRIFEEGLVTKKKDLKDYERLAVVSAHTKSNFTEIKQVLDYIMDRLEVRYEIENTEHSSFIKGRVGRISVGGKGVAFIGEINPKVLSNFNINVPVVALELNLTDLYNASIK